MAGAKGMGLLQQIQISGPIDTTIGIEKAEPTLAGMVVPYFVDDATLAEPLWGGIDFDMRIVPLELGCQRLQSGNFLIAGAVIGNDPANVLLMHCQIAGQLGTKDRQS